MTTNTEVQQGGELPQDDVETLLTVFDMGLSFALCHRDFGDMRKAVKELQTDFTAIRAALAQSAASVPAQAVQQGIDTSTLTRYAPSRYGDIGDLEACYDGTYFLVSDVQDLSCAAPVPAASVPDAGQLLAREQRDAQTLATLLRKERERFEFLHSTNCDADGWEWGVARVHRAADGRIEYLWGVSDHADIDAIIAAAAPPNKP